MGFNVLLPLSFVSNAFAPTQGMPGWLQAVADWNPLSPVAPSCRDLFGNPNPAATIAVWPMQHPELATILRSVRLSGVRTPLRPALPAPSLGVMPQCCSGDRQSRGPALTCQLGPRVGAFSAPPRRLPLSAKGDLRRRCAGETAGWLAPWGRRRCARAGRTRR